ncbi:unnamed protein product [Macrosiphum euphorbiae]|uniref:Uncharacterized protein n=1 Tax=Macrosiphum euphorbiae TaxID=13131 RepID=A0AAV0XHH4_9HEMI|nr:unnamed protein product [Macrosiphum euphorbiae]
MYMRTALATCSGGAGSTVVLSSSTTSYEEKKYLRATVVKNFVDIDKEMCWDLMRVSLLLHVSATGIENKLATLSLNKIHTEREIRNFSVAGHLTPEKMLSSAEIVKHTIND